MLELKPEDLGRYLKNLKIIHLSYVYKQNFVDYFNIVN